MLGFAVLGVLSLQKAVRRNARRRWAWGRVGSGPPLTRRSYAIWGAAFLAIAWVLVEAPRPSRWAAAALVLCFLLILAAGFADARTTPPDRDTRR